MKCLRSNVILPSLLALTAALPGQTRNPLTNDPTAVEAGKSEFRSNCAFCHGLGARGGGRGPNLTGPRKKHGNSDADLFRTIHDGVPGTDMPAAIGSLGVEMKDREIWEVIAYLRSIQMKTQPQSGNSSYGKELFFGVARCSACHMLEGKGGRMGPDLTDIGSARSVESLVESVRDPSRRLVPGYQTVAVVTSNGQTIKGFIMNEDTFSIQIMDTKERNLSLDKETLRSLTRIPESLMPRYDSKALSHSDLMDIVAFLVGSGGAQ
ncbi:MAG TPA: c-type cytochrome [Bryobacteraceae bacterium]|jgi:putative heme-binding domain-containing protein